MGEFPVSLDALSIEDIVDNVVVVDVADVVVSGVFDVGDVVGVVVA